jgi:hypothetical protein
MGLLILLMMQQMWCLLLRRKCTRFVLYKERDNVERERERERDMVKHSLIANIALI